MSTSRLSSHLLLWSGLWAAPAIWAVNMQLGQILPYADCYGRLHSSLIVSFVGAVTAVASGVVSWRSRRRASNQPENNRNMIFFIGGLSAMSGFLFAFALAMQGVAAMVLTGCER